MVKFTSVRQLYSDSVGETREVLRDGPHKRSRERSSYLDLGTRLSSVTSGKSLSHGQMS